MQKNLYYRMLLRRDNLLKISILLALGLFCTYPRLLLEVFIRKNFGQRYFKLSSAVTITFVLALIPLFPAGYESYMNGEYGNFIFHYLTWYAFLFFFMRASIRHHKDLRRNPTLFDFTKFSLFAGDPHPWFFSWNIRGKKPDVRIVETWLEPAPFFIGGLLLWLLGQRIGVVLTVSSILYSFSYRLAYYRGDQFILDKIDEIISNEELKRIFMEDASDSETRGFRFIGHKPQDKEMRRRMLELMIEEDESDAR